jgi:hypothetical protein
MPVPTLPWETWAFLALAVPSTFVVLYLFGNRNERAVRRDWELLLTPKGERLYQ